MTTLQLEELARRFVALELSKEAWTHQAHLLVGLWHVSRYGADAALTRLREGIRRLNVSNGVANTATGGYHETITRAYVLLLAEYDVSGQSRRLQERAQALLKHPLARPGALDVFYSRELLLSREARALWLPPDRSPLSLGTLEQPESLRA